CCLYYFMLIIFIVIFFFVLFIFFFFFFFFFQAEDGIRDDLVTGVQTCALPIYAERREIDFDGDASDFAALGIFYRRKEWIGFARSEERRVGKECRYRWSP